MSRLAIVQNADEPQILSTAEMLRAAGYDRVLVCGDELIAELRRVGMDTVLSHRQMEAMGYDRLPAGIGHATVADVARCDLFCEIKVRNLPHLLTRWPRLERRLAYLRVNGSQPEICPKGGDEVNVPVPVITACLWYGTERYRRLRAGPDELPRPGEQHHPFPADHYREISEARLRAYAAEADANRHARTGRCYVCWPPYPRAAEYLTNNRLAITQAKGYDAPYGLAHYLPSWGYRDAVEPIAALGVKLYGDRAPAGQIPHSAVRLLGETARALVHLKAVDCPGWALYEALLSGCPVVTGRMLNARMLAYPLLEDGVTCLEFGVPCSREWGRGPVEIDRCVADVRAALDRLKDPAENARIGQAGRRRLLDLMWSKDDPADVESFTAFCRENFA